MVDQSKMFDSGPEPGEGMFPTFQLAFKSEIFGFGENAAEDRTGLDPERDDVIPVQERLARGREFCIFTHPVEHEDIVVEHSVARDAVKTMEFELQGKVAGGDHPHPFGLLHGVDGSEAHMIADGGDNGFGGSGRKP